MGSRSGQMPYPVRVRAVNESSPLQKAYQMTLEAYAVANDGDLGLQYETSS